MAARYGGEEFTIVLPYSDHQTLRAMGERVRTLIEAHPFSIPGSADKLRVTASLGGATFPTDVDTTAKLIETADRMMYQVKKRGGNCLVTCDSETNTALPMAGKC